MEIGKVRFSLLKGPAFSVDRFPRSRRVIHEDPSIGIEPIAYVQESGSCEVVPSLWSLLGGRFVIASIRLEGASINLTKSGPASEPGPLEFRLLRQSLGDARRSRHPRAQQPHPLQIRRHQVRLLPHRNRSRHLAARRRGGGWSCLLLRQPARTDRAAQGLGSFTLQRALVRGAGARRSGSQLDRTGLGEITALLRGQAGRLHGTLYLPPPPRRPDQQHRHRGRLNIEDVHRWDLLPPYGQGWPLDIRGRLDLIGQQLELQSSSAGDATPAAHRPASAPAIISPSRIGPWRSTGIASPSTPLMELATHMGAQFPPRLKLSGTMDGAIGYSGRGQLPGPVGLSRRRPHHSRFAPRSFRPGLPHVSITATRASRPRVVRTAEQDEAADRGRLRASTPQTLDLTISTEAMKVGSLRAQVALAAVPWLEQVTAGEWSGDLHYHREPDPGRLDRTPRSHRRAHRRARPRPSRATGFRPRPDRWRARRARSHRTPPPAKSRLHRRLPLRTRRRAAPPLPPARRELDAAELETELMPTLRRSTSLIARALGRTSLPDWLRAAGPRRHRPDRRPHRGRPATSKTSAPACSGTPRTSSSTTCRRSLDRASVTGKLAVNLRVARAPPTSFTGKVERHGLAIGQAGCRRYRSRPSGAPGSSCSPTSPSEGTFTGIRAGFRHPPPWRTVSGTYTLALVAAPPSDRPQAENRRRNLHRPRQHAQEDGRC